MALCSVADIRARTTTALSDAALEDLIEAVSDEIEDYVGAWLEPRTGTFTFDVETTGSTLRMTQGDRRIGVRSVSALSYATSSQPTTGGTYTSIPTSDLILRPRPYESVIASSVVLIGSSRYLFQRGFNMVTVTGTFGPAGVAPRVREAAIKLVLSDLSSSPGVASETVGAWSITYTPQAREAILDGLSSLTMLTF
jgi:hypothetical protein